MLARSPKRSPSGRLPYHRPNLVCLGPTTSTRKCSGDTAVARKWAAQVTTPLLLCPPQTTCTTPPTRPKTRRQIPWTIITQRVNTTLETRHLLMVPRITTMKTRKKCLLLTWETSKLSRRNRNRVNQRHPSEFNYRPSVHINV